MDYNGRQNQFPGERNKGIIRIWLFRQIQMMPSFNFAVYQFYHMFFISTRYQINRIVSVHYMSKDAV